MSIRHAPLYVIAATIFVAALALAGAPAPILLAAVGALGCPVMLLLTMRADDPHPRRSEHDGPRKRTRPEP